MLKKSVQDFFNHGRSCASVHARHWGILPGTKQKRSLLRIRAPATFELRAQHDFCLASFSKHLGVWKMAAHPCTAPQAVEKQSFSTAC